MPTRPRLIGLLAALAALALAAPAGSLAAEQATTTVPSPAETPSTASAPPAETPPAAAPTTTGAAPTPTVSSAPQAAAAPQVQAQHPQGSTRTGPARTRRGARTHSGTGEEGSTGSTGSTGASAPTVARGGKRAPAPSALTPSLPFSLSASLDGVPGFFIENFRVPPFLLPIYQAAGSAYGIPWQVLAAINEVETDYGRDLSVSSAGAEGWMQFLPAEWAQYGVDATGSGFRDPYNPTDAIFAAARYLSAAGGETNIRAAVYSYNHSQSYVNSVLLRAELLGGTPPQLLGAVVGLTEARFPVHAAAHFSDGFQTLPARGARPAQTLVGTTIDSQTGAPVIAAQDGEIIQIGHSAALGGFIALRDAFGNTYIYAQLGSIASLYPVLRPVRAAAAQAQTSGEPAPAPAPEGAPSGPATAGAQPGSPLAPDTPGSTVPLGLSAGLEAPPPPAPVAPPAPPRKASATVRVFREGSNDVYLHPLRVGVQVIAGTVLGHLGPTAQMLFQLRPAAAGAPLIDPKPILDGWVALENTAIHQASAKPSSPALAATAGQVLLESTRQLQHRVLHDRGVRLRRCERQVIQGGDVGRRLLATLEFLSASGLKPTATGLACGGSTPALEGNVRPASGGEKVDLTAINSLPIADHQGQGSVAEATIRKLLTLQGSTRPRRIISPVAYPAAKGIVVRPSNHSYIQLVFSPPVRVQTLAHASDVLGAGLSANEWLQLIARLGEIPNPTVASKPSAAAIPDAAPPGAGSGAAPSEGPTGQEGQAGGNN